jgi:excisionase family DNA binding protein
MGVCLLITRRAKMRTPCDRGDHADPAEDAPALEALALLSTLGWTQALFRVKEAQSILALSRAAIYRDLAAGRLQAVKIGSATRITAQSLARRIAELPRAVRHT